MPKKITELPLIDAPDANDPIPIVDLGGNVTKRTTPQALFENAPAGSLSQSALDPNSAILKFLGRTWYDETAGRAAATTYTNNHGYPIDVAVTIFRTQFSTYGRLLVDGVTISASKSDNTDGDFDSYSTLYATVPPGSTYRVTLAVTSIEKWYELY